jgi:hypothetical protein
LSSIAKDDRAIIDGLANKIVLKVLIFEGIPRVGC